MDKLNKLIYNAISHYYKSLDNLGYMPIEELNKIRALDAIGIIINMFPQYLTNEDCLYIMKALNCLSKSSCFIGSSHFLTQESILKEIK